MSHSIQPPLRPELARLSRLSTKESTTSSVTIVKPSNEDQLSRTTSRGGQYKSSGRGGAGNAREAPDYSQRAYISDGPEDFSSTKGRELRSSFHPDKIISTGRGGLGNVRPPSQNVIGARSSESLSTTEAEQAKYERLLIRKHEAARAAQMNSVGRGGFGNVAPPSPPRSQSTESSAVSQSDRKMNANMTPQGIKKMRELLPGRSSSPSWTTAL